MIIEINGVEVNFPFEPYELQKDYMRNVIEALENKKNAVLESPTGTGKTLCLLTSSLAWMLKRKAENVKSYQDAYRKEICSVTKKGDMTNMTKEAIAVFSANNAEEAVKWNSQNTVIYTSRTHSQLAQAMKELKFTEYRTLKGIALGSRDQLCINEDVLKEAKSGGEKILMCRAKVKSKQCRYHGNVESALKKPEVTNETVMDIEDLVRTGKSCNACPYYMSKQLSGDADIVFLPYNYVLDPKLLKSFKLQMQNAIVIIDEAHNVEKVCQDAASVQITSSDIATCMDDLTFIMKQLEGDESKVLMDDESKVDFTAEDCALLKEKLLDLEKVVDSIDQVTSIGRTMPGGAIFDILSVAIPPQNASIVLQLLNSQLEYLTQSSSGKVFARKGVGLSKVSDLIATVYGSITSNFEDWKRSMDKSYRLHVEPEVPKKKWSGNSTSDGWLEASSIQTKINNKAKVLNYWCFNPGFGMSNLTDRDVHSIILTSGTLTPIKPLISELGLDVGYTLENPHIIKPSQVFAKIIPKGPDGTVLNANFQNRDNPKFLSSIAMTIRNIALITPNGLLVFFPSYVLMRSAKEAWERSGMWKAIDDVKPIFIEAQDKAKFEESIEEYYSAVKTSRGAIFMAVLRGKVSEGLDFKDENGRAVIVIGLPFPPYKDPRVVLKQEYLKVNRNNFNQLQSGQEWYNMEATRAVNQAIGRVIRHKDDYGAIFLCDTRFSGYKNGLSRWIRNHIETKSGDFKFGPILKELREFFGNTRTISKPIEVKVECSSFNDVDQVALAKVKSEDLILKHIKIENSNEIYGGSSLGSKVIDYEELRKFVKQEPKSTDFFGGLDNDVKEINFHDVQSYASHSKQTTSKESLTEYESVSKKRKLKMISNDDHRHKGPFILKSEPVRIKREIWVQSMPTDKSEFLAAIQRSIPDTSHYKYLLNHVIAYKNNKDFSAFSQALMPMFQHYAEAFAVLQGLRRYLDPTHKKLFEIQIQKHFIVE